GAEDRFLKPPVVRPHPSWPKRPQSAPAPGLESCRKRPPTTRRVIPRGGAPKARESRRRGNTLDPGRGVGRRPSAPGESRPQAPPEIVAVLLRPIQLRCRPSLRAQCFL